MLKALKFLVCLSMLWATSALATSPCKGDACIDSASASFIVPFDVFEAKCSEINPGLRAEYSAVVAYFLRNEDTEFIRKLRASKPYAAVRAEVESKVRGLNSVELGRACDSFSKEPHGPKDQSTRTR